MSAVWQKEWRNHCADLAESQAGVHYTTSADRLRRMLREGPLGLKDIQDAPEKFFVAHDIIAESVPQVGPGFSIRFTVEFNLFAGTIVGLGNPQQVASLKKMQESGSLGCFCLTETLAGVNSGLVVNTTCEWDEGRQMFLLDCPNQGASKNWISQGLTADMAVVVANLIVKGKAHGPHAFLMEIRRGGQLVPGVTAEDMGGKTIGNDLDNARITFSKVWLPADSMLDRHAGIEGGKYVQRQAGVSNMDMIGQRLYTGRTVIAASSLVFTRKLYSLSRQYSDNKKCWSPKGDLYLSDVPQLRKLYADAEKDLEKVEKLKDVVTTQLAECLRSGKRPSAALVERIAVLKVKAIETSISLCFRLKQELGSYALMAGTGFERLDYLQCCKFAEGDSRILMQKIARDRFASFKSSQGGAPAEVESCTSLATAMAANPQGAWNEKWETVYGLADLVIERVVAEAAGMPAAKL